MHIPFVKMQSLGNDFVVVDAVNQKLKLDVETVRFLSDRRRGVGCDQLLVVEPATIADCDFFFRVFNTDGSESGQCGNGVRCFHRFLLEQGLTDSSTLRLQTTTTSMTTCMQSDGMVTVDMGEPVFDPASVPFLADNQASSYPLDVANGQFEIGAVSMGNPHAVLYSNNVDDQMVSTLGPVIECHDRFPQRVNVGFATVVDRSTIKLRVFERGVGETQACGSGACAAVAVGIRQKRLDESVTVHLPGGQLTVQWPGVGNALTMTGSADRVFDGEIKIEMEKA